VVPVEECFLVETFLTFRTLSVHLVFEELLGLLLLLKISNLLWKTFTGT
jgi:hypothetical protein